MHGTSRSDRRAVHLAVAAVLALGTGACGHGAAEGPGVAAPPGPARTSAGAAVAAEGELRGTLLQFRRDVPARRLQIRLTAETAGLVVEGAELLVRGLPPTSSSGPEVALRPGLPVDLPVLADASDCTLDPGPPTARVRLRDGSGARRQVTVPLDDRGLVGRLHEADCAEQELRAQAAAEIIGIVVVPTGEGPALDVVVRLSRVGGADPVRVTGLGSNTVYSITALGPLPTLGLRGPVELELRLLPARCDVHALGESYRTGLIGLVLALGDGEPRPFVLTPDPADRARLEAFAVETCRARTE